MAKSESPKTQAALTAEITEMERVAAAKRAELEAFNAAENIRRRPLAALLQERERLKEIIARRRPTLAAHAADAAEFERVCDIYFITETDHSSPMYNLIVPTLSHPFASAARAVEWLSARIAKAEKDLAQMESKIVNLANEQKLNEMLPADLLK